MDKNFTPRILASSMLAFGLLSAVAAPASAKSSMVSATLDWAATGTGTLSAWPAAWSSRKPRCEASSNSPMPTG